MPEPPAEARPYNLCGPSRTPRHGYSRYYHVLETPIRYDYPGVSGKGRYRSNRFNTDFCRKAKVKTAMEEYPVAGVALSAMLPHSTMGGAPGAAAIGVLEEVYYARWN